MHKSSHSHQLHVFLLLLYKVLNSIHLRIHKAKIVINLSKTIFFPQSFTCSFRCITWQVVRVKNFSFCDLSSDFTLAHPNGVCALLDITLIYFYLIEVKRFCSFFLLHPSDLMDSLVSVGRINGTVRLMHRRKKISEWQKLFHWIFRCPKIKIIQRTQLSCVLPQYNFHTILYKLKLCVTILCTRCVCMCIYVFIKLFSL